VSLYRQFGKKNIGLSCLRKHLINDDALENNGWGWAREIPYDVKDEALRDFKKALMINKKHKKSFDMRFKSRKHPTQSLVILKKHWGHKKGAYAFLHSIPSSEPIPSYLAHDTRLVKRNGVFWLKLAQCSPSSRNDTTENQGRRSVVSLDPGIRSFITGYDPDGYAFEFGRNDYKRLHRLYFCTTKLQRLIASKETRCKKRSKLKKVKARILNKINNLVTNLHYNLIKFLTSTYDAIIIPVFKVKDMISNRRYLNKKSKQHLSMWSHYQFRKRLKDRARLTGSNVYVVTEEYTSRTCTKCGHICPKSSLKLKCCESCGHVTDRDLNGARNIFMKSLTEAFENSKSGA
jgi:putative transposase